MDSSDDYCSCSDGDELCNGCLERSAVEEEKAVEGDICGYDGKSNGDCYEESITAFLREGFIASSSSDEEGPSARHRVRRPVIKSSGGKESYAPKVCNCLWDQSISV